MRMREDAWQSESDRHKRVAYCCGKDECVVEGEERRLREGDGGRTAPPHLHAYNKVTSFKCCRNLLAACATPASRLPLGEVSALKTGRRGGHGSKVVRGDRLAI